MVRPEEEQARVNALHHPEGTSIGSDNCDFSKNSDYNGCL